MALCAIRPWPRTSLSPTVIQGQAFHRSIQRLIPVPTDEPTREADMIDYDGDHRVWVLPGTSSSYVLHMAGADGLRCLHWGMPLTLEQARGLVDRVEPWRPFEDPAEGTLDLAAAGAMRFWHAGVQVQFADGTRDLELVFAGAERTDPEGAGDRADDELVLAFADRHYPLSVRAHYRLPAGGDEGDVIERHLVVRNDGDEPVTVVRADSATWVVPRLDGYR